MQSLKIKDMFEREKDDQSKLDRVLAHSRRLELELEGFVPVDLRVDDFVWIDTANAADAAAFCIAHSVRRTRVPAEDK
mgnify:CR=1 FL=1